MKYVLLFFFALVLVNEFVLEAISAAPETCHIDGKNNPVTPGSRKECLKAPRLSSKLEKLSADQLFLGKQEFPYGLRIKPNEPVYCEFLFRNKSKDVYGGSSKKFFCIMTDPSGTYYDTNYQLVPEAKSFNGDDELLDAKGSVLRDANGKKRKGLRLKVKYVEYKRGTRDVVSRYREGFTEAAASRVMWAAGIEADAVYSVDHVLCKGCNADPYKTKQSAKVAGVQDFAAPVSVEHKVQGKTIEVTDEQGWKLEEIEEGYSKLSDKQKLDLLTLITVRNLIHHHNIDTMKGGQNRLLCSSAGIQKDSDLCLDPVAIMDDVGSAFGKDEVEGKENPRGDFAAYSEARMFRRGCEFRLAGRITRINDSERKEILKRLNNLRSYENVYAIFKAARMDLADSNQIKRLSKKWSGERLKDALIREWADKFYSLVKEFEGAKCL